MDLTSNAFKSGEAIPDRYTCAGEGISPQLMWRNIPDNTRSFVLIVDDPDAPSGTFAHWVFYNIPPDQDTLPENFKLSQHQDWQAAEGRNDRGQTGFTAPCPPNGETHRYYFRLYALNTRLDASAGATRAQIYDRMQDHILDLSELIGSVQRTRSS